MCVVWAVRIRHLRICSTQIMNISVAANVRAMRAGISEIAERNYILRAHLCESSMRLSPEICHISSSHATNKHALPNMFVCACAVMHSVFVQTTKRMRAPCACDKRELWHECVEQTMHTHTINWRSTNFVTLTSAPIRSAPKPFQNGNICNSATGGSHKRIIPYRKVTPEFSIRVSAAFRVTQTRTFSSALADAV